MKTLLLLCCLSLSLSSLSAQSIKKGEKLFLAKCASCHAANMKVDLTGPALGPSLKAWEKYPKEDLYAYIRNNQKLLEEGHPRAEKVWEEWQPTIMNSFPDLTDKEIKSIIRFIEHRYQQED